jgi:predicted molibdopterin-dependent oxidoreductase YjgC
VRICHEVRGAQAIVFREVNGRQEVGTPFDRPLEEVGCQFCAACVDVCPSGALSDRLSDEARRQHGEIREVTSICPYCGVGCRLIFGQDRRILRERPDPNEPPAAAKACVGRSGIAGFITIPIAGQSLIRKNGGFQAGWMRKHRTDRKAAGTLPHEIAVVASAAP